MSGRRPHRHPRGLLLLGPRRHPPGLLDGVSNRFSLFGNLSGTGPASLTATVSGGQFDPRPADDATVVTATIGRSGTQAADLIVTTSTAPTPVVAGGRLTCTITVANRGPDDAFIGCESLR